MKKLKKSVTVRNDLGVVGISYNEYSANSPECINDDLWPTNYFKYSLENHLIVCLGEEFKGAFIEDNTFSIKNGALICMPGFSWNMDNADFAEHPNYMPAYIALLCCSYLQFDMRLSVDTLTVCEELFVFLLVESGVHVAFAEKIMKRAKQNFRSAPISMIIGGI